MRPRARTAELEIGTGVPLPLGAHPRSAGVNFALFSRHATSVELLLFDGPADPVPSARVPLDPARHRTGDVWHVWVKGTAHGRVYGFSVDGPHDPALGLRFDPRRLLLDPYAHALVGTSTWDYGRALDPDPRDGGGGPPATEENAASSARCLVSDEAFDWAGDRPLRLPLSETVIYETHVRGLTIHPSSGVAHPGTFLGVVEKIPYLKQLGVTCVELMPVQEFNEREVARANPLTGEPLRNYWGYSTSAFFAPKEGYGTRKAAGCQVPELKTMVRELHRAGIEVLLDIALNHTAEGNERGPTLSFRGLDNPIYYLLDADPRFYRDFTGCGNTMRCNHPVVRELVLDCLRHWVIEMHVDGFRFDLASVLGRGDDGAMLAAPPLLEQLAEDPILRDAKLVAEAWDAAGAYQGTFRGGRWSEWNGRFRDDVRRFWRGDAGMAGAFATRLCGSADVYQRPGSCPVCTVNFVTCHDGFTLADLVSYRRKRNEANGEGNRDGAGEDYGDDDGVEGPSSDPAIVEARGRKARNFVATLFLSRGVPMLLGGDELGRTQGGNDNAWCQDSETSWYDWRLVEEHRDLRRFTAGMIAFRRRHEALRRAGFYRDGDLAWLAPDGGEPRWTDPETRALGVLVRADGANASPLCLLFNAGPRPETFALPPPPGGGRWRVAVDTSRPSPDDLPPAGEEPPLPQDGACRLRDRSLAVLVAR
jgi:isoamylase